MTSALSERRSNQLSYKALTTSWCRRAGRHTADARISPRRSFHADTACGFHLGVQGRRAHLPRNPFATLLELLRRATDRDRTCGLRGFNSARYQLRYSGVKSVVFPGGPDLAALRRAIRYPLRLALTRRDRTALRADHTSCGAAIPAQRT